MANLKLRQIMFSALIFVLIIWILREDEDLTAKDTETRELPPFEYPVASGSKAWNGNQLHERMLVMFPKPSVEVSEPESDVPVQEEQVQIVPEPVVDKTLKPMFSQLDEEHQVGLLAIVQQEQQRFAILQKVNFATKQATSVKVLDGGGIGQFTLTINSQSQVQLVSEQNQILLNLFKARKI